MDYRDVLGIYLGTTNSYIAGWKNGKVDVKIQIEFVIFNWILL